MSGRKYPYVPPWKIEIENQDREIKTLRSRLQDAQSNNRQFSSELTRANENIQAIDRRLKQQNNKILQLDQDMNELKKLNENSKEYAVKWFNLIKEQQQALNDLAMNRFFKKEYRAYAEQIEHMDEDIRRQQYQASIALAQNWHTVMKHDIPEIKRHFQEGTVLEMELQDSFEQLTDMINKKNIERQFDSDDGRVTEKIEIPYWASEEWEKATTAYNTLKDMMTRLGQMDLKEMEGIELRIKEIVDLINAASRKSEIRFLNYLRKMEMQKDIAKKLIERGFEIKDNIFRKSDIRDDNFLLMENERGEKIRINIGAISDQLNMEVLFNTLDPLTHDQRLKSILEAIGTEQYQTAPGYEHKPAEKELFDLKQSTKKQTS